MMSFRKSKLNGKFTMKLKFLCPDQDDHPSSGIYFGTIVERAGCVGALAHSTIASSAAYLNWDSFLTLGKAYA